MACFFCQFLSLISSVLFHVYHFVNNTVMYLHCIILGTFPHSWPVTTFIHSHLCVYVLTDDDEVAVVSHVVFISSRLKMFFYSITGKIFVQCSSPQMEAANFVKCSVSNNCFLIVPLASIPNKCTEKIIINFMESIEAENIS